MPMFRFWCAVTVGLLSLPTANVAQAVEPQETIVTDVQFHGNRSVGLQDLRRAISHLLDHPSDTDTLSLIYDSVLRVYETRGYSMVSISVPEERNPGIYRIQINELALTSITVRGNTHSDDAVLRRALPGLEEGRMVNLDGLGRELTFANKTGRREVQLNFSEAENGGVAVEIEVREEKPWEVGLQVNNTGSEQTGEWRTTLTAAHHNLWQRDHELIGTITKSPDEWDALEQYGLYYKVPFPGIGGRLTVNAAWSDTDSGRVAGAFDISGRGTHYVATWRHLITGDPQFGHYVSIGFAHKNFENTVDFFGTNLGVDVVARPVSFVYEHERRTGKVSYSGSAGLHVNLSGGQDNNDATYAASRIGAIAGWSKWTARFNAQWRTDKDWIVKLTEQAQYSQDLLISGEQFGVGGAYSVRGLNEREGSGDKGARGSFEVLTPQRKGHRGAIFLDAGKFWRNDPLPGETREDSVVSLGLGWRWQHERRFSVSADVARTLTDFASHDAGEVKAHIKISASF